MIPQRITVKFFVKQGSALNVPAFTPLFHKWIQNAAVEGLLLDVADYIHVPDGPGILLIGHDVDYGMDLTAGKPGLLVRRKRYDTDGSLSDILRDTLRKALLAINAIHEDGSTGVTIDTGKVEISLIDRLVSPNDRDKLDAIKPGIDAVLDQLFESAYEVAPSKADPRACPSLIATAKSPADAVALHERLEAITGATP